MRLTGCAGAAARTSQGSELKSRTLRDTEQVLPVVLPGALPAD
jgi:hypothetical protein